MSAAPVPVAAIAEAVAAARALLRLTGDDEAALLAAQAAAAIGVAEAFVGQPLIVRGMEDVLTATGAWQPLAASPVRSIQGVTVLPVDGAPSVLAVGGYAVDIDAGGCGWVRMTGVTAARRVAVQYSAGLASDWAGVPAPIAQGVALLIAHLFEDRAGAAPPAAVAALWRPWRRLRLMAEQHV